MRFAVASTILTAIASHEAVTAFCPAETRTSFSTASSFQRQVRSEVALIARHPPRLFAPSFQRQSLLPRFHADGNADEQGDLDKDDVQNNPYADSNYPELEFVNYDDPEYVVDQGIDDDEFFSASPERDDDKKTLLEIEAMREERRRRNDEYQFETYHAQVLRGGEISKGEWTVFQTDTFMGEEVVKGRHPEARHVPRLLKWDKVLKVVSRGNKIVVDPDADWRVDGERIVHEQRLATLDDFPHLMMGNAGSEDGEELVWEEEDHIHVSRTFWPSEMTSLDFRGPGEICVSGGHTLFAMPCSSIFKSNLKIMTAIQGMRGHLVKCAQN